MVLTTVSQHPVTSSPLGGDLQPPLYPRILEVTFSQGDYPSPFNPLQGACQHPVKERGPFVYKETHPHEIFSYEHQPS